MRTIEATPNYYNFPSPLLIGKTYYKEFKVKNFSLGACGFKIIEHHSNDENLEVTFDTYDYVLVEGEEKNIQVAISCSTIGKSKKASFIVEV